MELYYEAAMLDSTVAWWRPVDIGFIGTVEQESLSIPLKDWMITHKKDKPKSAIGFGRFRRRMGTGFKPIDFRVLPTEFFLVSFAQSLASQDN